MSVKSTIFSLALFFVTAYSLLTNDASLTYVSRFDAIEQNYDSAYSLQGLYGTD